MCNKIIIGLLGPFGSGCTYTAREHIVKLGYKYISLSEILREEYVKQNDSEDILRSDLQAFGNNLRLTNDYDYLARKAYNIITSEENNNYDKWVIDSIRNTHEVECFKMKFGQFYLFSIWANSDIRWGRISDKYNCDSRIFEYDDKRDSNEKVEYGQQISLCYQMADIVILNEKTIMDNNSNYFSYRKIVENYIDLIEKKEHFIPNEIETLMAMAYTNSWRSSCVQRKVGALISDDMGNVFSSGYNEVPNFQKSCKSEYGKCYRKHLTDDFNKKVDRTLNEDNDKENIKRLYKNNFKNLDYCRALHAEENAIVNMVRFGSSFPMDCATLYTTTYPCNLCANKIAQIGIKRVVYFEPYPMKEAKEILKKHEVEPMSFS